MFQRNYPPIIYGRKLPLREGFELANEEFFYKDLVIPIEDDLVDFIFDARGGKEREMEFDYKWPYPVDPEVFDDEYSSVFFIIVSIYPNSEISAPTNVTGLTGPIYGGFAKVDIKIEYKPGTDLNDHYKDVVGQLRNTLAHEIHHLTQDEPLKRPDCPYLPEQEGRGNAAYFTSACEIPAFVMGFRAEANHLDVQVRDLMKDYLNNYVKINALSSDEAGEVFDAWTGHSFA